MGLMYMKSISFIAIFATLLAVVVGLGGITDAYAQGTSGPSPQQQQQQQQQQSSNPYAQQQQSPTNPNGLGDLAGQGMEYPMNLLNQAIHLHQEELVQQLHLARNHLLRH